MSDPQNITVGGAPEGFDARLLAREAARTGKPVLHIARDDKRLAAMRAALAFFAPQSVVLDFPAWDCLPYDRVSPNADIEAARMATLATLAAGLSGPFILLTTVNAAAQRLPARAVLQEASFAARVGQQIDEAALKAFLVRMGFSQAPTVMEPGDYAVRGGIIDIYPPGQSGPVRLDLFGDVLDGARRFDPATQRTTEKLDAIELAPVSEVILDEAAITRFRQNYRIEFGAAGTDDPLYEAVSAGRKHAGAEHWLPFFHERLETLFDYLPGASVYLDDQVTATRLTRWETIADQYDTRAEAMRQKGRLDSVYKPCPPGLMYLDDDAWAAATAGHRVLQLNPLPQGTGPGVIDAGGRIGRNFAPERKLEQVSLFSALSDHVQARREEGPVVVASYSEGARERLKGLLEDEGIADAALAADSRDVAAGRGLYLAVWALEHGFEAPGLTVISEQDVLGDRLIRAPKKRRKAENFLTEAQTLSPGDLVVHVEHGVGRYNGLETITAAGAPHECLALEYAGGDRLFLPVENIELLSRYGHDEGLLDKLGGGAWQAKKAKLKERIRQIADKLIRVAAERALRNAPMLEPNHHMWEAFSARFPYQETDDQLAAIEDVLNDMGSGTPMDRLICGDVGFGKTEVAMRAAFIAAMSGVQVAVIAPTTLLARQHAKSFLERFRGFPVEVRQLSRFVSAKEAAKTRAGLADGTVDIVIGTHAVLAKTVKFQNLGLLIIDEEQHFGVTHKERLKQMRSDIHVLTLTATPIPRTLQMSLTGVRDLSIIGTPPVDRLSIRTYVSEFDAVTVREALLREHYRGGQSFVVVPRIKDLPEMEAFLREQVPEVSFVEAHGQMAAGELDDRMNAFYDGKYDVLLATTIVESGLDIPTANTMIVYRADMFGLAQLYQIRGRVGRAKTRAYAYLTTKPRAPLTPQAQKRLRVLGSLDTLGAGFTLASQDLDIRGAGNLVGEEQSGHVREVGFELYQSMLEEAIAKIKAGEMEGLSEADDEWSPQINLGVPVLIPEDYVPDLDVRLGLYRRLSGLSTKVELEGFAAELIDRFGKLPKEVNTLLLVVRIKAMCKRAGIARLDGGPKGATVQFHNDKFANPAGLVEFIQAQQGLAKVKDNKIILRRDWKKDSDKIKGAFAIARDLAEKVKSG
ncbi:transcription-repair coupling factor [Rhodovulum adriaticum]|uniref:Transcription-repair-coupling factor n=1 Tax=Rhodovulum adriaticum TaxID=35804 RepID=A0A4R2NVQ8_RHOAD|nr:transcription-repair coupling factor [Rhodovulum adriaticum]MBK1636611.1 transcription-repair coupling factor [Rhodovulum adriaticum]TCP26100.1 transcription-repair coupling factor [Rhodovulum adriaticum]